MPLGNIIRKQPPKVKIENSTLPLPISNNHKYLKFYTVFKNVNGHVFLHTKYGKVNFSFVQYFISRSAPKITTGLDTVKNL